MQAHHHVPDVCSPRHFDLNEGSIIILAAEMLLGPECRCGFSSGWHVGAKKACTRQAILTPCQLGQLLQKSSSKLIFATSCVYFAILFKFYRQSISSKPVVGKLW